MAARHQLRHIGVDRHQLDADADAGDRAPKIDAEAGAWKSHDRGRDRIPDQRKGEEDRPAAIAVGEMAQEHHADKQPGNRVNTKVPTPATPCWASMLNSPRGSGVKKLVLTRPGAIY